MTGTLQLVCVGKLRAAHWQSAAAEYERRLRRYTRFEMIEVKDFVGRGVSDKDAVVREGDALLSASAEARMRAALTSNGRLFTSEELAEWIQKRIERHQRLAFLIGGPLGLAPNVLTQCPERLALSSLTFPHELARVILLEQLYRAFTLLSGEKYHK